MNPVLARLRGPAAVHFGGLALTAAWFGTLVWHKPLRSVEDAAVAQVVWLLANAPYTAAALGWARRPAERGVRTAAAWVAATGAGVAGAVLVALAAGDEAPVYAVLALLCYAVQFMSAVGAVVASAHPPEGTS